MKGHTVPLPEDAPKEGETYRHYKEGDLYKVTLLALHSSNPEWVVVYEPLYEHPAAPFFARPLREWREEVEWAEKKMIRFTLVP